MGRPLAKRFFGNRNLGSASTTADDNLGGKRIGSVTISNAGSYTSALPTVVFGTPDLTAVGAVRATGTVHGKALSAVATAKGTGYAIGDIISQSNGATGTFATFRVTALKVISVTLVSGGANYDNDNNIVFDSADWGTALSLDVTGNSTGVLTTFDVTSYGVWTGTGAAPTTLTAQASNTRNGVDQNGAGAVFTIVYGVETVAVETEGDYTAVTSGAKATTANTGTGTNATLTITYGVKGVTVTEPGSGYTNGADAGLTFSPASTTAATAVVEADAGYTNNTNNQTGNNENAIVIRAKTTSGGTAQVGDIIKQQSTRRYKVKTGDGTAVCKLVADATPAVNEAYVLATDITGNEYFVTKITSRKCVISQKAGGANYEFADPTTYPNGQVVKWTFGTQVLNSSVKIENV